VAGAKVLIHGDEASLAASLVSSLVTCGVRRVDVAADVDIIGLAAAAERKERALFEACGVESKGRKFKIDRIFPSEDIWTSLEDYTCVISTARHSKVLFEYLESESIYSPYDRTL